MFKAKKSSGKWVEGNFVHGKKGSYIVHCWDDGTNTDCMQFIDVDPDTLCRSVDIPDDRGETVYENDVFVQDIRSESRRDIYYWIVRYGHYGNSLEHHGFYLEMLGNGKITNDFSILETCRSLGSIFDGHTLLPVKLVRMESYRREARKGHS